MAAPLALFFTAPLQVQVLPDESVCRPLAPDELRVQVQSSCVSTGTELLLYRGLLPADDALDATITGYETVKNTGTTHYPTKYGYCACGRVTETGAAAEAAAWRGRQVLALAPHAAEVIVRAKDVLLELDTVSTPLRERILHCPLLVPAVETCLSLLHDAAPLVGDRVGVVGAGFYGVLLAACLHTSLPQNALCIVEKQAARRQVLEGLLVGGPRLVTLHPDLESVQQSGVAHTCDVVIDMSGTPAGLNTALQMVQRSGRVVLGSWLGHAAASVPVPALGSARLHRSHAQIVFSQVSELPPHLSMRYDKRRRLDMGLHLLEQMKDAVGALCSQVVRASIGDAPAMFAALCRGTLDGIVRFDYRP
eukprot:ctg_1175.g379